MNAGQFIDACFRGVLRRPSTPAENAHYVRELEAGADPASILTLFTESAEFENLRTGAREFVPGGHFYSVVPSAADRERALATWEAARQRTSLPGITVSDARLMEHLEAIAAHAPEAGQWLARSETYRYCFENPAYSYGDGLSYFAMLCRLRPKRVVEIGSGYSSALLLDANDLFFDRGIDITFVEPYADLLKSLFKADDGERLHLYECPVQAVPTDVYRTLAAGDILFIDSTHVAKLDSDVNHLFFEVLPNLSPGVHVHVHDIFWPFEYPREWIRDRRAWNEAYLLHAFLLHNPRFKIVYFSDLARIRHEPWIRHHVPLLARNFGGHVWMKAHDSLV